VIRNTTVKVIAVKRMTVHRMRRRVIKMLRMKTNMIVTEVTVTKTAKRAFSPKPSSRISFRRNR
jgi:hypothetical protein